MRQELPAETCREVAYGRHLVLRRNHANLNEADKERLHTLFHYALCFQIDAMQWIR
ncbi:MAG: hypothetical protein Fur0021_12700 [Candidatus Promineifilaceae bacterium]